MNNFEKQPQKIAILRALQLGDLLVAVPAFRALRASFPRAKISLIGLPWAKDFVARFHHYFDDFIEFPGFPGLPEREFDASEFPHFLQHMQEKRMDLIVQMQGNGSITNVLVELLGASQTAGFVREGDFNPNPDNYLIYPEGIPEIERNLRLMKFLGIPSKGTDLKFPITADEWESCNQLLDAYQLKPEHYICIHPGSRAKERRWSPANFAEIGDALARMGFQIVLTGTTDELALASAVEAAMQQKPVNLAGKTSLGVVAALIANARLLVSNDTGVSHVAAALKRPSVVLFTVSDPYRWAPLNQELHRRIFDAHRVSPDQVMKVIEEQLVVAEVS